MLAVLPLFPVPANAASGDVEISAANFPDDAFRDYVNGAAVAGSYDEDIMNIITEEAAAYFAGDKSAAEVADLIQRNRRDRVSSLRPVTDRQVPLGLADHSGPGRCAGPFLRQYPEESENRLRLWEKYDRMVVTILILFRKSEEFP